MNEKKEKNKPTIEVNKKGYFQGGKPETYGEDRNTGEIYLMDVEKIDTKLTEEQKKKENLKSIKKKKLKINFKF